MKKDYNSVPAKNNMEVGKHVDTDAARGDQSAERPKLQSVVGVAPKRVKKSLLSRLVTGLVGPDGASNIGGYVSEEIVKPAVKNIIFDAITSGISMALFGNRGMPNRGGHYGGTGYRPPQTNYNNAYSSRPSYGTTTDNRYGQQPTSEPRRATNIAPGTSRYGVEDYVIPDRYDASHVLTTLSEYADRYRMVSVADYYDLIKAPSEFTDNNYGWHHDTIASARIVPTRGGFIIKFPPVEAL